MKKLLIALMFAGALVSVDAGAGLVYGNECPSNSYFYGGKCHQCPQNKQWDEKSKKCVNSTGASASKCPANAHCKGNEFMCNPGYYKKSKNAKVCTKCPAGYQCLMNERKKCGAGRYSKAGSSTCLICPEGTYSKDGATSCKTCPKGSYTVVSESSECIKCKAGEYLNGQMCLPCSGDTYSSAGASKCKSCPKGKKPNEKHTACVKEVTSKVCPKGSKLNAAGTACVKA